nr:endonuclease/exonuclease/phosphatase family protein [Streptomyces sp. LBUM 1477]
MDRHRPRGWQQGRVHGDLLRHPPTRPDRVRPLLAVRHPVHDRLQHLGRGLAAHGDLGEVRRSRGRGREFYVLNTHLDSVSQYARERSAKLVGETIAGWDRSAPVVVTGDFNAAAHDNRVYDLMLGNGLVDAWDAAASRSPAYGTYHGYRALKPDGRRIDWILTSPGVTTHWAAMNTFSVDGLYPSDHLPVQVSLTLG